MPKIYYDAKGFPLYDKDDGWKSQDEFQAAALNDMSSRQQKVAQQQAPPVEQGTTLGKGIATVLPTAGGIVGAMVPGAGETGASEVAGSALGTIIKHALRDHFPQEFGQNEEGLSNVADSLTDTLSGALPGIGKAATKALGASTKIAGSFMGKQVAQHITSLIDSLGSMPPAAQIAAKFGLRSLGVYSKMPHETSSPPANTQ